MSHQISTPIDYAQLYSIHEKSQKMAARFLAAQVELLTKIHAISEEANWENDAAINAEAIFALTSEIETLADEFPAISSDILDIADCFADTIEHLSDALPISFEEREESSLNEWVDYWTESMNCPLILTLDQSCLGNPFDTIVKIERRKI